jgi:hypothetical protein
MMMAPVDNVPLFIVSGSHTWVVNLQACHDPDEYRLISALWFATVCEASGCILILIAVFEHIMVIDKCPEAIPWL